MAQHGAAACAPTSRRVLAFRPGRPRFGVEMRAAKFPMRRLTSQGLSDVECRFDLRWTSGSPLYSDSGRPSARSARWDPTSQELIVPLRPRSKTVAPSRPHFFLFLSAALADLRETGPPPVPALGRQEPPNGPQRLTAELHAPVVQPRRFGVRRTAARQAPTPNTGTRPLCRACNYVKCPTPGRGRRPSGRPRRAGCDYA